MCINIHQCDPIQKDGNNCGVIALKPALEPGHKY